MNITCQQCDKIFSVRPSKSNQKFCSRECKGHSQKTSILINCQECNTGFYAKPCDIKRSRKYCSHKCRGIGHGKVYSKENHPMWKGGKPSHTCIYCGKEFARYIHNSNRGTAEYCSSACMYAALSGENATLWKGGEIERTCETCNTQFYIRQHRVSMS